MAIQVFYSDGIKSLTIEDNTINQQTSLDLPGRGYPGYGVKIDESLLHLLENFAATTAPREPSIGQLWYDTSAAGGLKVYNGANWLDAGGLKSGAVRPAGAISSPGDLWSDTSSQQLYLWNGTNWVLIGPEYSEGLITGAKADIIVDVSNLEKTVLFLYAAGQPIGIVSTETFTPKNFIPGFTTIKAGLNVSSNVIINGIADRSNNLVVDGTSVPGNQFMRKDQANISNEALTIRSNQGLSVGLDSAMRFEVGGVTGNIKHSSQNSNINISVTNANGNTKQVLRVQGTERVGVNTNPDEALHVAGNIKVTGTDVQGENGDLSLQGNADITGNLDVTGTSTFTGEITAGTLNTSSVISNSITPSTTQGEIGSVNSPYNTVYTNTVIAETLLGNFQGRATSAQRWDSPIQVQFGGANSDISSEPFEIDGTQNITISADVAGTFVTNKDTVSTAADTDTYLIQRGGQLFKVPFNIIRAALPQIPVGTIVPFGGPTAPDGWKLCDGSEVLIIDYESLFLVIGYNYGPISTVTSGNFKLPDLRGRLPLGADNMGGSSANRTLDTSADTLGLSNTKTSELTIRQRNLPEHRHKFESTNADSNVGVDQFYAVTDTEANTTAEGVSNTLGLAQDIAATTSGLNRTGIIYRDNINEPVNEPINIMPPYQTVNYIIYHGELE